MQSQRESDMIFARAQVLYESDPPVAAFAPLTFSMKQVLKAGEALKGDLVWSESTAPQVYEVFRIANNWRESHAYPMRSIRQEMIMRMRQNGLDGVTAARLKRMKSIRKKLRTISAKLNQIQDIGGCRVILPSITDVLAMVDTLRGALRHELTGERNYIEDPKMGGYRCHHLMYKFDGRGDSQSFNGRRIEIQVRTRLQHSWATAVEAVGLFRKEDMKAGKGDKDWLRLFDLMSAELAVAENCPESRFVPSRKQRVQEIRDLDRKLDAVATLERLRYAVRNTDTVYIEGEKPRYYRIEYNNKDNTVMISGFYQPTSALKDYNKAEESDNLHEDNEIDTVCVEADKIEDLKAAYPNYFGDVQLFNMNLKAITQGKNAREYTVRPKFVPPAPPNEPPDLSWFRQPNYRKWRDE